MAIPGATSPAYTLTAAELGRTIACRISATNDAGTGDATSEALYVSNPAPAAAAPLTVPFTRAATQHTVVLEFTAKRKLANSRRAVDSTVSSNRTAKFSAKLRPAGSRKAASKSGKRKVHLELRAHKRLKKGQKVVLTLRSGKTTKLVTAKLK